MISRLLIILLLAPLITTAQEPGAKLKFGKYKKSKDGTWYLHKMSNDFFWTESPLLLTKIDYTQAKIHYSKTFLGDTTSVSINGAYVNHNPEPEFLTPVARYTSIKKVTNKDWNLFRRYVRDSIARRELYDHFRSEDWLVPTYTKDNTGNSTKKNKSKWVLNWDTRIQYYKYDGNEEYPVISQMLYPSFERLNDQALFDERKFSYQYIDFNFTKSKKEDYKYFKNEYFNQKDRYDYKWNQLGKRNLVSLFRDSTMWITDSSSLHFSNVEDGLVSYYNYHPYFEEQPVTSINTPQAKAYLKWLEINHQKQLDKNEITLYVKYTLPTSYTEETLKQVTTNQFSLYSWSISNADYKKFVNSVQDSLARNLLAFEFGVKSYLTPNLDDELREKDEQDWNLNYKTKIDWQNKTAITIKNEKTPEYGLLNNLFYPTFQGDTNLIDKRKLFLTQYFFDFKNASIELEKAYVNGHQFYNVICPHKKYLDCIIPKDLPLYRGEETYKRLGKLHSLFQVDENTCASSDIFCNQDRATYIIRDILNVYPGVIHREPTNICIKDNVNMDLLFDIEPEEFCEYVNCELCPQKSDWEVVPEEYDFDSNPEALITNITYFQFVAYWRWRIKANDFPNDNENPVIQNYIPSKEEFKEIQNETATSHPQEVAKMPTPGFGYVVSFYEK